MQKESIILSINKAHKLFCPKSKYPIHNAWLNLLKASLTSRESKEDLAMLADKVSELMGQGYVDTLGIIRSSEQLSTYALSTALLTLRVASKKQIATTGSELTADKALLEELLAKHFFESNEKCHSRKETARAEGQKVKARMQKTELERQAAAKAQYNKTYVDFPSLDVLRVRKKSMADHILSYLSRGNPLSNSEYVWLVAEGFATPQVTKLYNLNKADALKRNWYKSHNPWDLVNAVASYRKASEPKKALRLIGKVDPFSFIGKNKALHSALLTTCGGAKRDLELFGDAIDSGLSAHKLTPENYRPCTLIGACKMLTGNIDEGHDWYRKAVKLGYKEDSFEQEMKSIYDQSEQTNKEKIKATLIGNGFKYGWLK